MSVVVLQKIGHIHLNKHGYNIIVIRVLLMFGDCIWPVLCNAPIVLYMF